MKLKSIMSGVVAEDHEFLVPKRAVMSPADMTAWHHSEAYCEYVGFILAMNEAVEGKAISADCVQGAAAKGMVAMLECLDHLVDEIPPIEQPTRFGNHAFRKWHAHVKE
ncbi:hypothetical protein J437_LFUL019479, partial [Ladona fulva]